MFLLVPKLDRETWFAGIGIGLLTVLYFVGFRLRRTPSPFPAKEFLVGFCFAMGALTGARQLLPSLATLLCSITLTPLFAANCLTISLAERGYDRASDPAAHFAKRPPSRKLPLALLILSAFGATALLLLPEFRTTAFSALIGNVLTAIILLRSPEDSDWVQPAADAVLWIPWLFVALESTGSGP